MKIFKAKGGVENIPRAFLTCTNDFNESVTSNLMLTGGGGNGSSGGNNYATSTKNDKIEIKIQDSENSRLLDISDTSEQPSKRKQLSFKSKLAQQQQQHSSADGEPHKQQFLQPVAYKSSTSIDPDRYSLHSSKSSDNQLDESQGFFMDLDNLDLERSTKSSRFDDGLNRNPNQLLRSLIDYRVDLKAEIESLNLKMSKIDKKISELLQLYVMGQSTTTIEINRGNLGQAQKSNSNINFLEIQQQPRNTFLDSSYSFGMNSNLQSTQMGGGVSPSIDFPNTLKTLQPLPKSTSSLKIHTKLEPEIKMSQLNVTTKIQPPPHHKSSSPKLNDESSLSVTEIQIQTDPLKSSSQKSSASHHHHHHHHRHHKSHKSKTDLVGSSAVAAAVLGASSLLNNSQLLRPTMSTLSSTPSQATHSNYNVNLIPQDASETTRRLLTTSASENVIREPAYRKLVDKKHPQKEKLLGEGSEREDDSTDRFGKKKEKK